MSKTSWLTTETWSIRYMVVDTSNWWFGRKVLVASEWITSVDWNKFLLHVDLTREQIKNSPEYDPSVRAQREYATRLHDHYGRSGYWKTRRDKPNPKTR